MRSRPMAFLYVRQKSWYAKCTRRTAAVKSSVKANLPPAYKKIEDNLASHFSTKVKLNHNKKGNGMISIEYYSIQDLNKILDQIGVTAN